MAVDDDERHARRVAHELFRFGLRGWKVQSELPNPVNFEAATAHVREEGVAEVIPCGADVDRHVEAVEQMDTRRLRPRRDRPARDIDRFFELWEQELQPQLESSMATRR